MLSLLFTLSFSEKLKPIVLIPGAMRSRLEVNSTRDTISYCSHKNKNLAWLNVFSFVPPFINCFFDYFALDYDEEKGISHSKENVSIKPQGNFGELDNIIGTGPKIFGLRLFGYLNKFIDRLKEIGYVEKQNLFAAPYDWRLGVAHLGEYFDNLRKLVENAYTLNGNTKVHLFSHSLGGWVIYVFLTEKTTPEWRQKYIDAVTLSAPSWSGSGTALSGFVRHTLPFVPFYKTDRLRDFIDSLGMYHIHLPSSFYYENDTLVVKKDGQNIKGKDVIKYIKSVFSEKHFKMAEANFNLTSKPHKPLDVPTNIAYNSGIKQTMGYDLKHGKSIQMEGDGLVGSKGLDWVCKNWNKADLRCHKFNSSSLKFIHQLLPRSKEATDVYLDMIFNGKVPKPAKTTNKAQEEL